MQENLKKISDLINNQDEVENEKKFKVASASLVCSIVDINNKDAKKYCSLFEKNFNLNKDEFEEIRRELDNNELTIDDKITYIKEELNNSSFEIMQFLKILNKFAIADGCRKESYLEFEKIRDKFLKEFY